MAEKIADELLSRLRDWDVEHVFSYAGTAQRALRRQARPRAGGRDRERTAQALLRGDPEAWDVVKTGVRSKAPEIVPGRG